jgi:hypothetical protein
MRGPLVGVARFELVSWNGKKAVWWLHLECGHVAERRTMQCQNEVALPPERVACERRCPPRPPSPLPKVGAA